MKGKIHSLLFFLFLFLFITITPLALLYSEGWRFDFEDHEVIKTGGISLKASPDVRAKVFINGKVKRKLNRWTNSAYLSGLIPKNYEVELKKEGYHSWKKNLKVKEGEVVEAKNILLLSKEKKKKNNIKDKVKNFYFSPDGTEIIYETQDKTLKIYEKEEQQATTILSEISTTTNVKWGPDSERLLLKTKKGYFVFNRNNKKITDLKLNSQIKEVYFHHKDESYLIAVQEKPTKQIIKINYKKEVQKPQKIITNYLAYDIRGNNITWLSPTGHLFQSELDGEIDNTLNNDLISVEKDKTYKILQRGNKTLLLEGNNLYYLTEEQKIKEIASSVSQAKISPDTQKVMISSDYGISIVYLIKQYSQPHQEKYEKIFLTRYSKPIETISWLDSRHLIFNLRSENNIKITEIDTRGGLNTVDYINMESEQIKWDEKYKTIYLLKEKALYQNKPPTL